MSIVNFLDSAVQSMGLKISAAQWLDMGSAEYKNTPDEIKAAAYQAAVLKGFKRSGILAAVKELAGKRYDDEVANFTVEMLKELSEKYPAKVQE